LPKKKAMTFVMFVGAKGIVGSKAKISVTMDEGHASTWTTNSASITSTNCMVSLKIKWAVIRT